MAMSTVGAGSICDGKVLVPPGRRGMGKSWEHPSGLVDISFVNYLIGDV